MQGSPQDGSAGRITELKSEIQSLIGILETQRTHVQGGDDAGIGASVQQLLSQMNLMKTGSKEAGGYGTDGKGGVLTDCGVIGYLYHLARGAVSKDGED